MQRKFSTPSVKQVSDFFIYLFGVLRRFQHCTGHITTGSWKGRGNQYIQFVRVLYCKLRTNGKQLPAFPLEAMPVTEPGTPRCEAGVLPLCHRDPSDFFMYLYQDLNRRPSTIDGYRMAIVDTLGQTGLHISQSLDFNRLLSSFHRDRPKKFQESS